MNVKKSQLVIGVTVLTIMIVLFYLAEELLFSSGMFADSERFGRVSIHNDWLK